MLRQRAQRRGAFDLVEELAPLREGADGLQARVGEVLEAERERIHLHRMRQLVDRLLRGKPIVEVER